jgi:hypothetical protein
MNWAGLEGLAWRRSGAGERVSVLRERRVALWRGNLLEVVGGGFSMERKKGRSKTSAREQP